MKSIETIFEIIVLIVVLMIYMLPSILVFFRKKSNWLLITVINILLGWTFIGWVVLMMEAFTSDKSS